MKKKVEKESVETMTEQIPEQSKGKRIANTIVNVVLVVAIVLAALCTYTSYVSTSGNGVPSIFGIRMLSIQTKSMYPTLNSGDMIFDSAVKDPSQLAIGDIITYWTVIDGERVLNTHRITQIYDGGGHLIFQTKGDNNTIEDSLAGLGKVFDYLQTSTGFLIVVVVPVALFFIYHLIQFFRVLFEYNNIKSKLQYEQERGKNEDILEDEKRKLEESKKAERERLENELREKLRAELTATMPTQPAAPEIPTENAPKETAEEMEARIRAEMEAEAKAKKEAEERAAMEAEIRAKIKAEMEAKAKEDANA